MATATATQGKKPLSDLMYDWLTILQNKAEGIAACDQYLKDAEAANASECVSMMKKIRDQDVRELEEIKSHVFGMIAKSQNGGHETSARAGRP
jgi:hypothetical protein